MAVQQLFVLDDDPQIVNLVRRICLPLGVVVRGYTRAEDFQGAPDIPANSVVFLDLGLQDGNGVDILRFLAGRRCRAAVFVMSGVDERLLNTVQRLGKSYGLNMQGVLHKPFRAADVRACLEAAESGEPGPRGTRFSVEDELHRAIMGNELVLHYQPKLQVRTGILVGAEALVRWRHPERGMIAPGEFLPAAEQTGLIAPLTHWVLGEAIRQAADWLQSGLPLDVSVNVPAGMLSELALPRAVENLLALSDLDGRHLTLEVTESAAMKHLPTAIDVLARLRLMRISLSIDDFGTGHASMIKLRQLPFNEIKIDQSFVQDITADADARALVETAIAMGRSFGMRVVAEGVENGETLLRLAELGCEVAQGYHISRPCAAADFMRWAREHRPERFAAGGPTSARRA